jgi:WD40 repeat protein
MKKVILWCITTSIAQLFFCAHIFGAIKFSSQKIIGSGVPRSLIGLFQYKPIRNFGSASNGAGLIGLSPDGTRLVTVGTGFGDLSNPGTACVWDVASGKGLGRFSHQWQGIMSVAFSPNGTMLATGLENGEACVWDLESGQQRYVFKGHTGIHSLVAFSPDQTMLATTSGKGTAQLWDLETGNLKSILEHPNDIESLAFSPDGTQIVTRSFWEGAVRVWDAANGTIQHVFTNNLSDVNAVAFSPNEKLLVTGSGNGMILVLDTQTGNELSNICINRHIYSVAFSPNGKVIAAGLSDHCIELWDIQTNTRLNVLMGHKSGIKSVAFNADGTLLLTRPVYGKARVWDIATGQCLQRLNSDDHETTCAEFVPNTSMIVTTSKHRITLWQIQEPNDQTYCPCLML